MQAPFFRVPLVTRDRHVVGLEQHAMSWRRPGGPVGLRGTVGS